MNRNHRIKLVVRSVATMVFVGAALSCEHRKLLLYNGTPSVPIGWYVCVGCSPARGSIVAFMLPTAAHAYAIARGESTGVRLLKPVLAVAGDRVSTLGGELRINGVSFGSIAVIDSAGRRLPHWRADRLLVGDELIVGSIVPHSFDSRFFGPIHAAQVQGVYRRLAIGSAGKVPAEPARSNPPVRNGVTSMMPNPRPDNPRQIQEQRDEEAEITEGKIKGGS